MHRTLNDEASRRRCGGLYQVAQTISQLRWPGFLVGDAPTDGPQLVWQQFWRRSPATVFFGNRVVTRDKCIKKANRGRRLTDENLIVLRLRSCDRCRVKFDRRSPFYQCFDLGKSANIS